MDILERNRETQQILAPNLREIGKSFEEEFLDRLNPPSPLSQPWFTGWLNPSYPVRVFLVATFWAIPGFLSVLILDIFFQFYDPCVAGTAGAILGAMVGGCLEEK